MEKAASEQLLKAILAALPETFTLTAFAGQIFRASPTSSYVGDDGRPVIYTQRFDSRANSWSDFAKGTVGELSTEIGDRSVRAKLRLIVEDAVPFTNVDQYVVAIARRHTIVNLGQPEEMRWEEAKQAFSESDEMYEGFQAEYRDWLKQAKKDAAAVVKASLPMTLANARDAFLKRGFFASNGKTTVKARAALKVKRAAKKAAAK